MNSATIWAFWAGGGAFDHLEVDVGHVWSSVGEQRQVGNGETQVPFGNDRQERQGLRAGVDAGAWGDPLGVYFFVGDLWGSVDEGCFGCF